jgi:TRAP-type transport system periplasmic protein
MQHLAAPSSEEPAMVEIIRVGGYAPPDSVHSRALTHFVDRLHSRVGDAVTCEVVPNVMDLGRPAPALFDMVEQGELTWCYFSTSYLGDRVPELQVLERPFFFADLHEAHAALDGDLGRHLTQAIEQRTAFRVLGFWDNGFRHLTNRLRPVRTPEDVAGMRVRLQPNALHAAMIEAWGGEPVPAELSEGIELIASGQVDAQENPLANSVAYGVDRVHRHVTMTGHLYGARGVYANAEALDRLGDELADAVRASVAEAITFQREEAAAYERELRDRLEGAGLEFVDLTPSERAAFVEAVAHLRDAH